MFKAIILIVSLFFTSLGSTLVYQKTQQADINYFRGHRLFEKGQFKEAIPFF